MLRNLISNAIKCTPKGGVTIYIQPDLRPGQLALQVIDTGIGLTPAQCATLFSDYVQPNPVEMGGTGLGLSMSRAICRALGGDLTVVSTPGLGSTFTAWVPVAEGA